MSRLVSFLKVAKSHFSPFSSVIILLSMLAILVSILVRRVFKPSNNSKPPKRLLCSIVAVYICLLYIFIIACADSVDGISLLFMFLTSNFILSLLKSSNSLTFRFTLLWSAVIIVLCWVKVLNYFRFFYITKISYFVTTYNYHVRHRLFYVSYWVFLYSGAQPGFLG